MHILGRSLAGKENHKCKDLVIGTFMYSLSTRKDASVFEWNDCKGREIQDEIRENIWVKLHRAFKVTMNPLLWDR